MKICILFAALISIAHLLEYREFQSYDRNKELEYVRIHRDGKRCFGQDEGCCTISKPCYQGEGNCNRDSECSGHLICRANSCPNYPSPFDSADNCCEIPTGSKCHGQDQNCCTPESPCFEGDGDCDSDNDCFGQLVCGSNNCKNKQGNLWDPTDDCCTKPKDKICKGKDGCCCTKENPCFEGDGDCDYDNQCYGDLKCGKNNCARKYGEQWDRTDDCCYRPTQYEISQMTKETKNMREDMRKQMNQMNQMKRPDWARENQLQNRHRFGTSCQGQNDNCCTSESPCFDGDGDCDKDSDCYGHLVCGQNNCRRKEGLYWDPMDDCCTKPTDLVCRGKDNGCCTKENPCFEGDGDCDYDNQCYGDLKCGKQNCARRYGGFWDQNDDCCYRPYGLISNVYYDQPKPDNPRRNEIDTSNLDEKIQK